MGIDDVTISSVRRQTDGRVPDDVLYLTKSMSSGRLFNSAFATFILPCCLSVDGGNIKMMNMSNRSCYSSGTMCQGQQSKATGLKRYHGHPDTPPIWTELLNAAQNIQRNYGNRVLWSVLSPIPVGDGYLLVCQIWTFWASLEGVCLIRRFGDC